MVALQFVAVVLGDDRIQLARHTIQGCADSFLGQFLPRQAVTPIGLGFGFRGGTQQEWQDCQSGDKFEFHEMFCS